MFGGHRGPIVCGKTGFRMIGQACFINSIFVSFHLNILIRFVCKIVGVGQTGFFVQIITLCKICAAIWILHAYLGIKLVSYGLIVI